MSLEANSLTVHYGSGRRRMTAVENATIKIPAGSTIGLVGESGSGKSTIARAIVGLVPIANGQILLGGEDMTSRKRRNRPEFRRRVQMIFQDPYASLNPRMTVNQMLSEVLRRARGRWDSQRRGDPRALLDMVGLPESAMQRYPHQFSGGQRQRLAIARALAVRPDLIINDEVTSSLDVSVQAAILNLLKELQRELHLSYLFISHDLSAVRYMSETISVMYLGRIIESSSAETLFHSPQHPYTRALIDSVPQIDRERRPSPISGDIPDPHHPPSGCRFRTRCAVGPLRDPHRTICIEEDPQKLVPTKKHEAACHFVDDVGSTEDPDSPDSPDSPGSVLRTAAKATG